MIGICDDLRKSVLQAAIQGRLTLQLPEDGDAESLYAEIQQEKQRLIKEGKIKKEKLLPEITEDDIPFDIPENWKWVRLGTVIKLQSGQDFEPSGYNDKGQGIPYLTGASNLEKGNVIINRWTTCPRCVVKGGTLLIVCKGAGVGKMAFLKIQEAHIARQLMGITTYSISLEYVKILLNKNVNDIRMNMQGIIPGISREDILNILFPLPPLDEQKRIVARVDELMNRIDEMEKTEKDITALYEAFPGDMKASLLQAAIQGKLTEQLATDGDAETLYADIQKEKQRLTKEGKIKKEKPLPEITDDDIPFDIPENWKWVRLGTLLKFVSDGTHKTPTYVSNGIPFLSVQNISKGYFDFSKIKYISEREHEELTKRCLPQRSDILVCRIGTLGRAIKVTLDFEFSIFVSLGLLRSVSEEIVDWIIFIINSPYGSEWIDSVKVGGGTHTNKINLNSFPDMLIPLPPLAEQKRLVEKLAQILPLCDSMKEAINATA